MHVCEFSREGGAWRAGGEIEEGCGEVEGLGGAGEGAVGEGVGSEVKGGEGEEGVEFACGWGGGRGLVGVEGKKGGDGPRNMVSAAGPVPVLMKKVAGRAVVVVVPVSLKVEEKEEEPWGCSLAVEGSRSRAVVMAGSTGGDIL